MGKHPAVAWGKLSLGDPVPKPEPGAGVGLKTGAAPLGSDVFVVDLDGPEASKAFAFLGDCPQTRTVKTPRGLHLYFQHPGFPVKTCAGLLAKGVDIRGEGGFVVAEGSPHRSGEKYVLWDARDPAPAPAWLLAWLRTQYERIPDLPATYPGDVTDPEELAYHRELFIRDCRTWSPSIQGEGGDRALWHIVQRGAYDLSLPEADVLELVRDHFDPRCVPPWGAMLAERVRHKCKSAKTTSTRPRFEPFPADVPIGEKPNNSVASSMTREKPPIINAHWLDWTATVAPPEWLVGSTMVRRSISTWIGDPDALKTWVAMHLCACVASGRAFLGNPVLKGRVIMVDYETGEYYTRRRIQILGSSGLNGQLGYLFPDMPLTDVRLWSGLRDLEPTLVMVDSLSRGCPGTDENSTDMAIPYAMAKRLLCESPAATSVLFIHHLNKSGDIRGSSGIRAANDVVLKFTRDEGGGQKTHMTLDRTKVCDRSEIREFSVVLTDARGIELAPATTLGRQLALKERIMLKLHAAGVEGIRGHRNLAEELGVSHTPVHQALLCLQEEKRVYRVRDGEADRWIELSHT